MKQICWIFLAVCAFSSTVSSQSPNDSSVTRRQEEINRQIRERDFDDRRRNLERLNQDSLRSRQESLINARREKTPPLTAEQRAVIKQILSPNSEDTNKYKNFLRQSDTGLFRLFPDLGCESNGIIRVDGNCANLIPGSWFYSFRQKAYSNETYFDIRLKDGNLISDGFLLQGILVTLGDVPLEDVSLVGSGLKFLADFKPRTKSPEVKEQFLQIAKGIESDGYKYTKAVKASENMTYAMRVVAYRNDIDAEKLFVNNQSRAENMNFLMINGDKRVDSILAFRIVRKDADGNITILWKELKQQNAPKIIFPKNEKSPGNKSSN